MKAHQRLIREQRIGAAFLEGRWQHDAALDIAASKVRAISHGKARALIVQSETMPAVASHCFGIFFGEQLGGAVVYGPAYGENLGSWDRYGYTGKIIGLLRGAPTDWAPKNTASKLISGSMKLLPAHYKVITATVDPQAGEFGTVYQAAGFDYVGAMTPGGRLRIHDGGKTISERTARRRYGTSELAALERLGLTVERVPRKGRYFAFRGSPREREGLRAAILDQILPYPKRPSGEVVGIKFAGRRSDQKPGFVRVRRRQLKDGGSVLTFDLLRSVRVPGDNVGKPRHVFVMTLGSQRSDRDDARFWPHVTNGMVRHGLSPQQRQRVVEEMTRKGAR